MLNRRTLTDVLNRYTDRQCLTHVHTRASAQHTNMWPMDVHGLILCLLIMPRGGATAYGSRVVCHSVRLFAMHISSLAEN